MQTSFQQPSNYDFDRPKLISADVLLGSLEAAEELGIDLGPSLASNQMERDLLVSPKGFLPLHTVVRFLNDVAERYDCPDFGFHVARHHPPLQFGLTGQLLKFAATLGQALDDSLRFGRLYSEVSQWRLEEADGYASLLRYSRVNYPGSLLQYHLLAVTMVFKAVAYVSEGRFAASQIGFTHAAPSKRTNYQRYFGAPVNFNHSFNGFVFPVEYMNYPRSSADDELYRIIKSYLESQESRQPAKRDLISTVQHHIRRTLGSQSCNLESIAQLMSQSPRSLQRDLASQEVTFRQLLMAVRQEIAEHYIRHSTITLAELADLLGYRNASAFSRAFKQQTGKSPQSWKLAQLEAD